MMDELRRFSELDNETVNIGDLEENSVALPAVEPRFNKEDCPEAAVREGIEELTHQRG